MSVPTAIIAEDEAVLRDELRARLAELWPELAILRRSCRRTPSDARLDRALAGCSCSSISRCPA